MNNTEKTDLIEEIKKLIGTTEETIEINPNYLEYFEVKELEDIKEELLSKKKNLEESTSEYVEEIYKKLI